MTFWSDHPKWSYCRLRPDGTVSEVVEKQVISNEAMVGICNFAHGRDDDCAQYLRPNGGFYVAPTYNRQRLHGAHNYKSPADFENQNN